MCMVNICCCQHKTKCARKKQQQGFYQTPTPEACSHKRTWHFHMFHAYTKDVLNFLVALVLNVNNEDSKTCNFERRGCPHHPAIGTRFFQDVHTHLDG